MVNFECTLLLSSAGNFKSMNKTRATFAGDDSENFCSAACKLSAPVCGDDLVALPYIVCTALDKRLYHSFPF